MQNLNPRDRMDTDHRFYMRRAAEEASRAKRAITPAAQARHDKLATHFLRRAKETGPLAAGVDPAL